MTNINLSENAGIVNNTVEDEMIRAAVEKAHEHAAAPVHVEANGMFTVINK